MALRGGERCLSIELKEQLHNFVLSLLALSPSRNYITQFLFIVHINRSLDYRIAEEAYPDLLKNELVREALAKIFDLSITDKISLEPRGYGAKLVDFVKEILSLFEDGNFRAKVNALLKEEFPGGVPNLAREWLEVRVRGAASEPTYGQQAITILRKIMDVGRAKIDELEGALNVSRGVLLQCLNLLKIYGLVSEEYDGSYRPSEELRRYPDVVEGV